MRLLVTGGGGFLGRNIALRLAGMGYDVHTFGRRSYADFPAGITQVQGDLKNPDDVLKACDGMDAVFHAGALTGIWGPARAFEETNVLGTQNVIDACRSRQVSRLIYTSSPSVVSAPHDLENADETTPYPEIFLSDYPRTKAEAERRVLSANGEGGLATVSLRPHLIYGPGDPHLIPRILQRASKKQLVRVGNGENLVDIIYIDNAVEGHIRALESLQTSSGCAGRAYFLSDGHPVNLWDWINQLLAEFGLPPVTRSLSHPLATFIGGILEGFYRGMSVEAEPRMTRFLAAQLAKSHYFDISNARRDLSYVPLVTQEEGWKRMVAWFREHPAG